MAELMTPKDWTLLVIAAGDIVPLHAVHLQKSLFVLSRHLSLAQLQVEVFYDFIPHDYGPLCLDIFSDAENLWRDGLIHICRDMERSDHPLFHRKHVMTTGLGGIKAAQLRETLAKEVVTYLDNVVRWATSLSFSQIVSAIHHAYPDMKVNAVFAGN
jgi:hypothetical protein